MLILRYAEKHFYKKEGTDMSTKTYNMGRVVGWSSYEEFLKENPNVDPTIVTSKVYSTMVTYGVTRIAVLRPGRGSWKPVEGTDTVFYTQTVKVPGATYGVVPIVGIDYDFYMNMDSVHNYADAPASAGTNKELLEKAFRCIFTCYVSDVNGNKVNGSADESGHITFAAYPDIIDYLDCMAEVRPAGQGLPVIVRGLALEGLDNVSNIYFGPQGLVIGTGGGEDPKYCEQDTIDISALCLNASGYIWMSTGGTSPGSDATPLVNLTQHPRGEVLVSTFGYLNPEFVEGTGAYENLGKYAFTYAEYEDIKNTPNFNVITTQVDALDTPNDYLYLVVGESTYEAPPPSAHPLDIIPVRKSDYYVNWGTHGGMRAFDNEGHSTMRKALDLTYLVNYPVDDDDPPSTESVIVLPNKVLSNYVGSFWKADCPSECKVCHSGVAHWVSGEEVSGTPFTGRTTLVHIDKDHVPTQVGEFLVVNEIEQSETNLLGLYQCVKDKQSMMVCIRRGAYLTIDVPTWVSSLSDDAWWRVDLSSTPTQITDNVLYVNNRPVYPGELLVMGTRSSYKTFFVINTISGSNTPELIVTARTEFYIDATSYEASQAIAGQENERTNFILIDPDGFTDLLTSITKDVYTAPGNTYSFTMTNTEFTPGMLFDIRHHAMSVYGDDKEYRYIYVEHKHGMYKFASGEVWTANPNLSAVAGHPGLYNSAFPLYGQTLPTDDGSWHYNAPAALAHTPAKKMFADFGYNIADYVHEAFQDMSLGKFLQECVIRKDLTSAPTESTLRDAGVESNFHLYSKDDLHYTSGNVPTPTAANPITASLNMHASTPAKSYFSTAYYTATLNNGTVVTINNPDYPIWASVSKAPDGTEIVSMSVTDNSGSQLDFSGNSGTIEADTVTWLDMLIGLGSGKSVDVLKGARFGKGSNDCTYIETAEGTRLYISTTEPTGDIPEGSIGIGW